VLEQQWARIEAIVTNEPDGPWMYAVTSADLRRIDLTP
jgi:hypothetical protein